MSSAEILFQRLLQDLKPIAAANGFKRRGQNFICQSLECWGVINFQKSRYSSVEEKSFTINLAIAAKRILAYRGIITNTPPPAYACHWTIRIGELMAEKQDKWWTVSEESNYSMVESDVKKAFSELAIPIITSHLSEKGLFDLWESKLPGSFEYPRLKDKSILLAIDKRVDEMPTILQRIREMCKGTLAELGAEEHIAQLKKHFSGME
jgi:hypothetical protein